MAIVIDPALLADIAGQSTPLQAPLAEWMNRTCPSFGIDSAQEYCHFLAQACHETDHFRTLLEYASGTAMEGRLDLGNTQPGDGPRFKGRGIFQTSGRANYLRLGIRAGSRDLFLRNPALLEQPRYAVWSACVFWDERHFNDAANHADSDRLKKKFRTQVIEVSPVEYISLTLNGGRNGLEQRIRFYQRAQALLM
jgi:putative chitinase